MKGINEFKIGDILEQCLNPNDEKPDWRRWARFPLQSAEDVASAKELVTTNGACLGTYTASFVAKGDIWPFRTRRATKDDPFDSQAERFKVPGDHYHNTVTGQPIGPRG